MFLGPPHPCLLSTNCRHRVCVRVASKVSERKIKMEIGPALTSAAEIKSILFSVCVVEQIFGAEKREKRECAYTQFITPMRKEEIVL